MFALGIFDIIQCIPHFITGIFTLVQSVFHPILAKLMGVLATPAYIAYASLTVILSFNRFVLIYSPNLESKLFNKSAVDVWIACVTILWFLFAASLSTPWATISYFPALYSWDYDDSLNWSYIVKKSEMVMELGSILLSAVFYSFIIVTLYKTVRYTLV
ncbi:hypothetical protein DICVIV_10159 [Dictyocaulus viviparus]|uniref:Uncharacterized protein n=1 Tax=Dictyocaulus viviparus TaxID=29172 RepID=A0A0D8XJ81_DICVI|nr:hypothetical protein DICVIV_10159 [Dictyocaulus viviparus]